MPASFQGSDSYRSPLREAAVNQSQILSRKKVQRKGPGRSNLAPSLKLWRCFANSGGATLCISKNPVQSNLLGRQHSGPISFPPGSKGSFVFAANAKMWQEARKTERKVHAYMDAAKVRAEKKAAWFASMRGDPVQSLRMTGTPCKLHHDIGAYRATENNEGL